MSGPALPWHEQAGDVLDAAIERDRVNLGVERAQILARALRCHPAVLVFPSWDIDRESAA